MVRLKRVYEPASEDDGLRILVERLWPRGLSKEQARIDLWLKDVAPSAELRSWYHHDAEKWDEFQRRYRAELQHNPAVEQLQELLRQHRVVIFVYAARDAEHNSARLLQAYMEARSTLPCS